MTAGGLCSRLQTKSVMLCLGSGGVGKTTIAAALAIALVRRGERVVVLTIDPARRLADALGQGGTLGNDPTRVDLPDDQDFGGAPGDRTGELWAAMLDPGATFEHIIRTESADEAQAERILDNRLFANLTTSLSGTNEYMAAERLHQLHIDPRFDRVIIDTPPSRHAFDFLDSPGRLTRFVDHRLYRSVFASRPRLLRPLNAGTQVIMRLLARLVGSHLVDDVITFFSDFEGLDQGFRRRADEIDKLLTGPETGYVVITAPRGDRLREAEWIFGNLRRRDRPLDAVVVNRVLPIDVERITAMPELPSKLSKADRRALEQNMAELTRFAEQEAELLQGFQQQLSSNTGDGEPTPGPVELFRIAEQRQPVRDLPGLSALADLL